MTNVYDLMIWTPVAVLAFGALLYVGLSLRHWFGRERHHLAE